MLGTIHAIHTILYIYDIYKFKRKYAIRIDLPIHFP